MEEKLSTENMQETDEKRIKTKYEKIKSKKGILLPILLVVVLLAGSASFYYFSIGSRYYSTDNAKVTAEMYTITPGMSGELLEWSVKEGDIVNKNEIMGRQEVLPYITSPIDGMVVKNNGAQGQIVNAATQLAVVADTDNLYIGVNIEETDIVKIQIGQSVDVKIDAYSGKTFKGVVDEIDQTTQTYFSSPTSFSTSGTYTKVTQLIPVKVVIENDEDLPLTLGMNATVKIHINEAAKNETEETSGTNNVIDYTSSIEAADQVGVSPNVSGKVSMIDLKIGQRVQKGDVLFKLDSADTELQVKQAAANYNAALSSYTNSQNAYNSKSNVAPAQTAYDEAKANYARLQTLYDGGAISKVELDNGKDKVETTLAQLQTAQFSANTALDAAKAQQESAKAALKIVQKKLNDCIVKAPISGEVVSKSIDIGDMASPQTAAIILMNDQNVIVHINVTETNISKVKIGAEAEIRVQAIDVARKGTVVSIAPACDIKTGMFPVEILVNNTDSKLKPGMMTDVKLLDASVGISPQTN